MTIEVTSTKYSYHCKRPEELLEYYPRLREFNVKLTPTKLYITLDTADDFIKLSRILDTELVIGRTWVGKYSDDNYEYYVELYDDYRE